MARLRRFGVRLGRTCLVGALVAAASVADCSIAVGQTVAVDDDSPWLRAWRPLALTADLPRDLPALQLPFPFLLSRPAPRTGLFWSAGNPAGLTFEVENTWSGFQASAREASGDYRRPLDPGTVSRRQLSGVGWRPLEARGAAMGRVVMERTTFAENALANVVVPYTASPYVVMDTAGSALGRTAALLEGAAGWRLGRLGFGIGLGYESGETRTIASPVPRVNISAASAVSGGLVWDFGPPVRVGVYGRWRADAQRIALYSIAAPSRVYVLEGYFEPAPFNLVASFYNRRIERDAVGAGFSIHGIARGVRWTVFGERNRMDEEQHRILENNPPKDRWTADAWSLGGALEHGLDSIGVIVADARYTALEGRARRADLDDITFTADEKVFRATAELRIFPPNGWRMALGGTLLRERRLRRDRLALIRSDVEGWTRGGALEVARSFGPRFALSAGGALSAYGPAGGIPNPGALGPVFRRYVAPELALYASPAQARAGAVSARWQARQSVGLWLVVRYDSLTPVHAQFTPPYKPSGQRGGWDLVLGVDLGEGSQRPQSIVR